MTKNYDEAMLDFVANQDEINRRLKQLEIALGALVLIVDGSSTDGAGRIASVALERIKLIQVGGVRDDRETSSNSVEKQNEDYAKAVRYQPRSETRGTAQKEKGG